MEEEKSEQILELFSGGGYAQVPMERIGKIISKPQIIPVPGAPGNVAGLVYYHKRLIAVRYLEGAEHKDSYGCAVLVYGEDNSLYGLLADSLSGGDTFDTVYE